jgi:hypothetical protein
VTGLRTTARTRWCLLVLPLALAACFTSTSDYRETAESFIVGERSVGEQLGVTFVSATCTEPPNQTVGTVFSCTAVDDDGAEWRFDVEIAESNSIVITEANRS